MKPIDIIILSLVAVAVVLGIRRIIGVISGRRSCCSGDAKSSAKRFRRVRIRDTDESHYPYRADLTIAGMSCENCVKNVEAALDSLSGTWATVDLLRLSLPDKKLIALADMLSQQGKNVKVISDDYTIQNTLKIMNIPYSSIMTDGIKGVYNWKKVCQGCKKEYDEDYIFDDCEICGSKIYEKRVKVDK